MIVQLNWSPVNSFCGWTGHYSIEFATKTVTNLLCVQLNKVTNLLIVQLNRNSIVRLSN